LRTCRDHLSAPASRLADTHNDDDAGRPHSPPRPSHQDGSQYPHRGRQPAYPYQVLSNATPHPHGGRNTRGLRNGKAAEWSPNQPARTGRKQKRAIHGPAEPSARDKKRAQTIDKLEKKRRDVQRRRAIAAKRSLRNANFKIARGDESDESDDDAEDRDGTDAATPRPRMRGGAALPSLLQRFKAKVLAIFARPGRQATTRPRRRVYRASNPCEDYDNTYGAPDVGEEAYGRGRRGRGRRGEEDREREREGGGCDVSDVEL